MDNNSSCKIVGIRTVKIKMFDGIVGILTNVKHVPDLKENLILLSNLDLNGYKFIGEGGVIKVSKWTFVVMKGKKYGRLYVLQGSTITSDAVVFTFSLFYTISLGMAYACWTYE